MKPSDVTARRCMALTPAHRKFRSEHSQASMGQLMKLSLSKTRGKAIKAA